MYFPLGKCLGYFFSYRYYLLSIYLTKNYLVSCWDSLSLMTFGQHYLILTYLPTSIYIPFITRLAGTSLLATDTYHFPFLPHRNTLYRSHWYKWYMHNSGGWKIQKMVKKSWLSVKKMWIWCEKFQKNLGSIGGSLEEPQPKHVHWGLALRFAHYMSFARQFADLKNFTRYV